MSDERTDKAPIAGRLDIVRDERTAEAMAYCPYRQSLLRVGVCFECKDCGGLAMDRATRSWYVVCSRAETDGICTTARIEHEDDTSPPSLHLSVCKGIREGEDEEGR